MGGGEELALLINRTGTQTCVYFFFGHMSLVACDESCLLVASQWLSVESRRCQTMGSPRSSRLRSRVSLRGSRDGRGERRPSWESGQPKQWLRLRILGRRNGIRRDSHDREPDRRKRSRDSAKACCLTSRRDCIGGALPSRNKRD